MTKQLSPAAKAVLDATNQAYDTAATVAEGTAVALRAAAENFLVDWDAIQCCDFLLDMADELEAQ
jgi:hypothetical protein